MLARSCIAVGTGEDEKEARRCMESSAPHPCAKTTRKDGTLGKVCVRDFYFLFAFLLPWAGGPPFVS